MCSFSFCVWSVVHTVADLRVQCFPARHSSDVGRCRGRWWRGGGGGVGWLGRVGSGVCVVGKQDQGQDQGRPHPPFGHLLPQAGEGLVAGRVRVRSRGAGSGVGWAWSWGRDGGGVGQGTRCRWRRGGWRRCGGGGRRGRVRSEEDKKEHKELRGSYTGVSL